MEQRFDLKYEGGKWCGSHVFDGLHEHEEDFPGLMVGAIRDGFEKLFVAKYPDATVAWNINKSQVEISNFPLETEDGDTDANGLTEAGKTKIEKLLHDLMEKVMTKSECYEHQNQDGPTQTSEAQTNPAASAEQESRCETA